MQHCKSLNTNLHAAEMVFFSKRVTPRRWVLLAAAPDVEAFLLFPESSLLVAPNSLQLLLHTHPWPAALRSTQLLFYRAAWTLLLASSKSHRYAGTPWGHSKTCTIKII